MIYEKLRIFEYKILRRDAILNVAGLILIFSLQQTESGRSVSHVSRQVCQKNASKVPSIDASRSFAMGLFSGSFALT